MFEAAPVWAYKGAVIDLDFANNLYWGGTISRASSAVAGERMKSLLSTGSNAVSGVNYQPNYKGILTTSTTASLRISEGVGLWSEKDTSNICLWSRDHTNAAWTKTTMTAAKNQIGADLVASTASSLTATAGNATSLQSITSASNPRVFSAYVKRITGTGTINITQDNGGTWTDITSLINTTSYTRVQVPIATTTNPTVGFRIVTNTDAIAVDFCQMETLAATGSPTVATNPMLTTSAAVTRCNGGGTDEAFFDSPASNHNAGIHWINNIVCKGPTSFVMITSGNGSATACNLCGTDAGAWTGGTVPGGIDGTAVLTATGGIAGLGNVNKIAVMIDGFGKRACVNGGAIASTGGAVTSAQATHGGLGDRGAGDQPINGYISRIAFWTRGLTEAEMVGYTQ